jgi:hypothetical protein
LIWLRIGTGGRLLWVRYWTFVFHKSVVNFLTRWDMLASPERLCSMKLVIQGWNLALEM